MTDEKEKAQEIQEKAEREEKEKAAKESEKKQAEKQEIPNVKSPLEEARALDESIKKGTAEIKKLLERNEKVMADAMVTGKGFAGQSAPVQKTEDEKWAEDAKKRYAGTGMDPTTEAKETTYS